MARAAQALHASLAWDLWQLELAHRALGGTSPDQGAVEQAVRRAVRVCREALEAVERDGAPQREIPQGETTSALLSAWDVAAAAYGGGGDAVSGRDVAGRRWMPMLRGLQPRLPLDPDYRRLGMGDHGARAQTVLLAVADEAGLRPPRLDWGVLAQCTCAMPAAVQVAVARLAEHGWCDREPVCAGAE